MIVFKNLGKKEINSSWTIIFDSRTIKRLKANSELLRKEEVYQAIFYPDDMLINNFYFKHVKKNSRDPEFTILVTEQGKEPTLKECEELIRIALISKWKTKSSFFFKTYYGKLDFQISMYLPDSYTNKGFNGLFELPSPDAMYLNITEHIIAGYFEQSLTLFSRPSYYNEFEETITGDLDIYLALGGKFNSFGSGLENTVSMIDSFSSIDNKIGAFAYFIMNNLQYKVGAYYNIRIIPLSLAYPLWGVYINIMGNL